MITYTCDRCGRQVSETELEVIEIVRKRARYGYAKPYTSLVAVYEFCGKCADIYAGETIRQEDE